jgi:peptide/nickel transport system ATP-binding protein
MTTREPDPLGDRPLLNVEGLRVRFPAAQVDAVRGIGFTLRRGECLAIVGESGSGKSVTARALLGLVGGGAAVTADRMELAGESLAAFTDRDWRRVRGRRVGFILQDALSSLDPLRRVAAEVAEPLRNHGVVPRGRLRERVLELLRDARVPEPELRARQYPHELSGGLRQRVLIASSVAANPDVLIADEPTTALDVTTQARVLDLLAAKRDAGIGLLLISHDLSVVARLADRVAVMHRGVLVEHGPLGTVLDSPAHPYTRRLLAAVPSAHPRGTRLSGDTAAETDTAPPAPTACSYAGRCPLADDRCRTEEPPPVDVGDGHRARCWRAGEPLPAAEPVARAAVTVRPREVLAATGLTKTFRGPDGRTRTAVRDVTFTVGAGEALGILGESGSGKTTTAEIVMGLREPDSGQVRVLDMPWSGVPERVRRPARRRLQLIQQDPLGSFDPRYPVERIIGEALAGPGRHAARRHRERIVELLGLVGLDAELLDRRPRRLSGGQRQRVAIARALAPEPAVIVCDEPVSALDVSVQAQILDLFADLRARLGIALVFISHDIGVIRHVCDRVLVMRDGSVVETGPVEEVLDHPAEPYTRELLAAVPRLDDRPDPASRPGGLAGDRT